MGQTLRGVVRSTWLRGTKIFDNQTFPSAPIGREHTLSSSLTTKS
jgi:allantoinase